MTQLNQEENYMIEYPQYFYKMHCPRCERLEGMDYEDVFVSSAVNPNKLICTACGFVIVVSDEDLKQLTKIKNPFTTGFVRRNTQLAELNRKNKEEKQNERTART